MLLAVGVTAVRCRALPSGTPMLRRQGKQKGRRRVLLSDLKALLLRPPLAPMNGQQAVGSGEGSGEWSRAAGGTEGAGGTGESTGEDGSSSAEDCPKEKVDILEKLDKLGERLSLSSCTDSGARTPLCRICFQGPEQGELLSPCRCSGSVRCTHEPCLIKWISERGSWSCELCYYKYQVIAISTKNPLQWQAISLTVIEKVQIAAAVLGSLFLIASISWLVWSSLSPSAKWQRQDLLFQICYAMYGFMDLVCIALIVHEGPSVFRIFNRWQAVNQQWKVLNYDKLKDTEDPQKGGASSGLRSLTLPLSHRVGMSPPNGSGPSPSTSSLMAVTTATATPGTVIPLPPAAPETEESSEAENGPAGLAEHHCAYNLLQLLSQHLRPQEPRPPASATTGQTGQPGNNNRELVMRVTTV
ncbi:E3 ubiquitin-protein ligase MARCHF4 [Pygocentrus nattereri]|uniref:RING-type E3 ubiquitin transferase n=1 Tax=Pygocentrus nattereri TaxID=42514 RepID=A0A3B4C1X1_PYGNA|nr:E3 ubiquitin-protein ligase MARCHF4 [Pygocentrus nattereri]